MAVKLSAAAQFDLFQIAMEGLDQFGPAELAKYEAGLQKTLDTLSRNPRITVEYDSYHPPVRIHPFQAHIIIYRIENEDVFVVRVCHSREDWTRFA